MSTAKPIFVVLGATGNQGGSIISHFLSLTTSPYTLRGVTRDVASSTATALSARGVEMVAGNYDDPASLDAAFKGATVIFSVTDYWLLYGTLMAKRYNATDGQSTMVLAKKEEIQQLKNIIDSAAKVKTLERFIFSSLPNTEKLSGGKYSHVHQFDGKAIAEQYGKETYPELWAKTSVIYAGFFLENYLKQDASSYRPKMNKTNDTLIQGAVGDVSLPMFTARNDTGPIVHALIRDTPGKKVIASGSWLTFNDFAKIVAKVLRKDIKFIDERPSFNITDPDLGKNLGDMMGWYIEFGYDGHKVDKSVLQPSDLGVEVQVTSVEEWAQAQDWEQILDVV